MKTNYDADTRQILCAFNDSIFINSGSYSFVTKDKGITWDTLYTNGYVKYIDETNGYLYVSSSYKIYKIHKDSSDWKQLFNWEGLGFNGIYKLNSRYYLITASQILQFNEDWTDYKSVLEYNNSELLNCMAVDSVGTLYAGSTDFMNIGQPGGVYKSYDNGETWTAPDLPNHFVRAMAVDSQGRIFVGTCGHYYDYTGQIYRSNDNGNTWQMVASGAYVFSMAINSKDEIFVGLDYDSGNPWILFSNDHGESWQYLNDGLSTGNINDIAISPDGYVYLATGGGSIASAGVYRSVNSTTGIEEENHNIANGFELYQNYPNPFNNETKIKFSLNESSEVELSIFNIKGELVESLVQGKYGKGIHSVNFRAEGLTSGIYYYNLNINNEVVATKKMLYLR